jgi:hypothetical protein
VTASTQRREFLKVQSGAQSVLGTAVPATTIMAALTDIRYRPDTVVQEPAKLNGNLAVSNSADVLGKGGHLQIGGYLTFEDILFLLEMGYKTVSPSNDAGTPNIAYSRVYAPTLTAADQPKFYTLETGTNLECFQLPSSFLESFEFTARIRDYTNFTAVIRAQDYLESTFTAALTQRSVERALGQNWEVYIDDAALGAMGGTRVTDCVVDFTFRSGPLYMWANCMNGSLLPEGAIQQGQKPELMITFQLSSTTLQLFRDYQAGTKKFIRLINRGHAIHGTGVAAAPATPVTGATSGVGILTGTYDYKYTYVYVDGGETAASAAMAAPITDTANKNAIAGIATGPAGVVARRLYRTTTSGVAPWKYLATINDNTTTTYTDNAPDSALGINAPSASSEYTGPLVTKKLQIDLSADILQFPDTGQAQAEGALSLPVTFSGASDDGGSWGKLVEYLVVDRLVTIP